MPVLGPGLLASTYGPQEAPKQDVHEEKVMRTPITTAVALALGALGLSACSGTPAARSASSPSPVSGQVSSSGPTVATSPMPVDTLGTTPPTTSSDIPDGTYRTRLTPTDLAATGIEDQSQAGNYTLIVKKAYYFLRCGHVTPSGDDCGHDGVAKDVMVEAGWLRGPGSTLWFVHDLSPTSPICPKGVCPFPKGGYRLTLKATPAGIRFSGYVGLGDEAGGMSALNAWTARPWVRIA